MPSMEKQRLFSRPKYGERDKLESNREHQTSKILKNLQKCTQNMKEEPI
jgi:hypothetical protein